MSTAAIRNTLRSAIIASCLLLPVRATAAPNPPPSPPANSPLTKLQNQIDEEAQQRAAGDAALKSLFDAFLAPRPGHLGKSGSVFIASTSDGYQWVASEDGYAYLTHRPVRDVNVQTCDGGCDLAETFLNGSITINSSVELPDGAVVKGLTCFWYDAAAGTSGARFTFKLQKRPWYARTATTMATLADHTNNWAPGGPNPTTTNTIAEPIIDSFRNAYYVVGTWYVEWQDPSAIRFYGILIDYEYTR